MDQLLDGIACDGAGLAVVVMVTGAANMLVMATMWVLYHSLVSMGHTWFSFVYGRQDNERDEEVHHLPVLIICN